MIKDFKPGQNITDFFLVRNKELRDKKHKKGFYLSIELGDSTGRIFGSLWDGIDTANKQIIIGEPAKVLASVIDWKGRPHLSIQKIRPAKVQDNLNLDEFIPKSEKNIDQLLKDIHEIIKNLQSPIKALLKNIFSNDTIVQKLRTAPAGKLWHHCYQGGLLEHTLSVTKLVIKICECYRDLNKEMLIAGALLHDIGKLNEFENKGFIEYSDEGRLHSHIVIGYHMVANEIEKIPNFGSQRRNELLHLILSHQGLRENGSPVVPMTKEAFVLHFADELDSKMGAIERIEKREKEAGKKWSHYVKLLDRFLYFGEDD
jgi:3'-5' exoribonuclease